MDGRSSPSITQTTFDQNLINKTIGSKTYDEKDGFLKPIQVDQLDPSIPAKETKQIKI